MENKSIRKKRFNAAEAYLGNYSIKRNGQGQAPIYYSVTQLVKLNPLDLQPNLSKIGWFTKAQKGEFKTTKKGHGRYVAINDLYNSLRDAGIRTQDEYETATGIKIERTAETLPEWLKLKIRKETAKMTEGEATRTIEELLKEIEQINKAMNNKQPNK